LETLDEFEAGLPAGLGIYVEAKVVPGDAHPSMGPGSLVALRDWMLTRLLSRPMLWASFDSYALAIAQEAAIPVALITDADRYFISAVTSAALGRIPTVVVHGDSLRQSPELLNAAFATAAACGVAVWTWDTPVHLIAAQSRLGVTGFCVDEVAAAALELDALPSEVSRVDAPLVDELADDLVVLVG
jgi:glycerophosphoryl diester phosphodiesterase